MIKKILRAIKGFVYRILYKIFGGLVDCAYAAGDWFWDIARKFEE
jgi:hypothetical protein